MFQSVKWFALTTALCASSEARRAKSVRSEDILQKADELARGGPIQVAPAAGDERYPEVAMQTSEDSYALNENREGANASVQTKNHDGRRLSAGRHRRRSLYLPGNPSDGGSLPFMGGDANPIGLGTIPGSYGLLVMIFGERRQRIKIEHLRRIVLDRRFPTNYDRIQSQSTNQFRKVFPSRPEVNPSLDNINFIICPFLSTLVNERVLPVKQHYSRRELTDATIKAGLDRETTEEHVADNFENDQDDAFDIWNLEGETDEHQTSTGINDCITTFSRCGGEEGRRSCSGRYTNRICQLPKADVFEDFVAAVDGAANGNKNGFISINELNAAADQVNLQGVNAANTVLPP